MHSPPRKVSVTDQEAWKIPPCVSNWKNAKGYTIPLDKRMAADGRGLQEVGGYSVAPCSPTPMPPL
jgi:SNW domain-containing protein 1